ncbi:hypothetical protein ACFP2G_04575 [Psittacicella hinzii]
MCYAFYKRRQHQDALRTDQSNKTLGTGLNTPAYGQGADLRNSGVLSGLQNKSLNTTNSTYIPPTNVAANVSGAIPNNPANNLQFSRSFKAGNEQANASANAKVNATTNSFTAGKTYTATPDVSGQKADVTGNSAYNEITPNFAGKTKASTQAAAIGAQASASAKAAAPAKLSASNSQQQAADNYYSRSYVANGTASESALAQTEKALQTNQQESIGSSLTYATDSVTRVLAERERRKALKNATPDRELTLAEERALGNGKSNPALSATMQANATSSVAPKASTQASSSSTPSANQGTNATKGNASNTSAANSATASTVTAPSSSNSTGQFSQAQLQNLLNELSQADLEEFLKILEKQQQAKSQVRPTQDRVVTTAGTTAPLNRDPSSTGAVNGASAAGVTKAPSASSTPTVNAVKENSEQADLLTLARQRTQAAAPTIQVEPEQEVYVEQDPVVHQLNTLFDSPDNYIVFKVRHQRGAEISAELLNSLLMNKMKDSSNTYNSTQFKQDVVRLSYNNVWRLSPKNDKEFVLYYLFNEFGQWITDNRRNSYKCLYIYVSRSILDHQQLLGILMTQLSQLCSAFTCYLDLQGETFTSSALGAYAPVFRSKVNKIINRGQSLRKSSRYTK